MPSNGCRILHVLIFFSSSLLPFFSLLFRSLDLSIYLYCVDMLLVSIPHSYFFFPPPSRWVCLPTAKSEIDCRIQRASHLYSRDIERELRYIMSVPSVRFLSGSAGSIHTRTHTRTYRVTFLPFFILTFFRHTISYPFASPIWFRRFFRRYCQSTKPGPVASFPF